VKFEEEYLGGLRSMALLLIALFGLLVPNGLFIYWAFAEFTSIADVLSNKLALAFMLEAFVVLGIMTAYLLATRSASSAGRGSLPFH
jgi:hypothetical protein